MHFKIENETESWNCVKNERGFFEVFKILWLVRAPVVDYFTLTFECVYAATPRMTLVTW